MDGSLVFSSLLFLKVSVVQVLHFCVKWDMLTSYFELRM